MAEGDVFHVSTKLTPVPALWRLACMQSTHTVHRCKVGNVQFMPPIFGWRSRDISVGIATGCMARVRVLAVQDFSLLYSVQTGSGAHLASYTMGTGGSFPGGKAAGAWSWPLTSILCRDREWWSYISTPPHMSSWPWSFICAWGQKRSRDSRSCLHRGCSFQYNCHEILTLNPTWIASLVFKRDSVKRLREIHVKNASYRGVPGSISGQFMWGL
jgi:hypothetical protein